MFYLIGVAVMGIMAILFLIEGLILLFGHGITTLHSYHYKNVKEEDKKNYATNMGIGFLILFITQLIGALVNLFTETEWGWLACGGGFLIGFVFLYCVQKKYNGGLF